MEFLGIITKARKYLNRETLLKLYNAFVFPYLTYCVEVWGTAPKKYLDPIISKLVTQRIGLLMFKHSVHSLPIVIESLLHVIHQLVITTPEINQN